MSFLDPAIALYVAAAVALLVWVVLFFYLWSIDRRTRELHRKLSERPEAPATRAAQPLQAVRNRREEATETSRDGV
ncbi:MAG: hypothetical protein KatS3mg057_0821 [Herpetosiphonaceae bacterium]|nr:MAG: hypothetical protein KatS3mg057_0821 [Herpetosiphonaceae bacterium]